MALAKREISVSLDEHLGAQLERERRGPSVQVNAAVRADFESRRRHKLLEVFLDRLDKEPSDVNDEEVTIA